MQSAQIVLQIEPTLEAAAEKIAAAEHRSLAGLIENLLADYCKKQLTVASSSPSHTDAAPKAAAMAASTIDHIGDRPSEERLRRKKRLIRAKQDHAVAAREFWFFDIR